MWLFYWDTVAKSWGFSSLLRPSQRQITRMGFLTETGFSGYQCSHPVLSMSLPTERRSFESWLQRAMQNDAGCPHIVQASDSELLAEAWWCFSLSPGYHFDIYGDCFSHHEGICYWSLARWVHFYVYLDILWIWPRGVSSQDRTHNNNRSLRENVKYTSNSRCLCGECVHVCVFI